MIYRNVKLTATDYDSLPRFKFVEHEFINFGKSILLGLLGILIPTTILGWLAAVKLNRHNIA